MRLYPELAPWWPLLSPPEDHAEEAWALLARMQAALGGPVTSVLELGSGGGHLVHHLPDDIDATLLDASEQMLAWSRQLNPGCTHVCGDMRQVRLAQRFDVVLLHDAVMYLTSPEEVAQTLATAVAHLRAGGVLLVQPDTAVDYFEETTLTGGSDHPDGRAARLVEWNHSLDGHTFRADIAVLLRHADGRVEHHHEQHVMGIFTVEQWLFMLRDAGLAGVHLDLETGLCFVGHTPR